MFMRSGCEPHKAKRNRDVANHLPHLLHFPLLLDGRRLQTGASVSSITQGKAISQLTADLRAELYHMTHAHNSSDPRRVSKAMQKCRSLERLAASAKQVRCFARRSSGAHMGPNERPGMVIYLRFLLPYLSFSSPLDSTYLAGLSFILLPHAAPITLQDSIAS